MMDFLQGDKLWMGLMIALVLVEAAKRACAYIPGKKDDEIVGTIHKALRWIVDFIAGKTGRADDPALIKRD
jgi:hypothetical protein